MTHQTHDFDDIRAEFDATVGRTVYATMVTVDSQNRPRTRALIPVWEVVDGAPLGWLATYRTPVKAAHIANNPHVSFSYWAPRGSDFAAADVVAGWVDDEQDRRHVWDLYARTSPQGAGYDLGAFWTSPTDPKLHVLRLDPYRVQVIRGLDLRNRIWTPTHVPAAPPREVAPVS